MQQQANHESIISPSKLRALEDRPLSDQQILTLFKEVPYTKIKDYGTAMLLFPHCRITLQIIDPSYRAGTYRLENDRLVKQYKRRDYPCHYTGPLIAHTVFNPHSEYVMRTYIFHMTSGTITGVQSLDQNTVSRINEYLKSRNAKPIQTKET